MNTIQDFHIAVLPGDGIGREVMPVCLDILTNALRITGNLNLRLETLPAGADTYRVTGEALPAQTMESTRAADAVLLGAMGLPNVRYPDGTEISPQLDLRVSLGLHAGVRPIRAIAGIPTMLEDPRAEDVDIVLIRESTEGMFATAGGRGVANDRPASDSLVVTRKVSEKLFDFAFRLARRRRDAGHPGKVTCVEKSNALKSFAFFQRIFNERARLHPDVFANHTYVDAAALNLVRRPWDFDVMVTENLFGDILSDLWTGLIGGMGFAPSADVGDNHAVFQPCHGSAPDIVGLGKANPTAMILSSAMMLEWLGEQHDSAACVHAADLIRSAVDAAFVDGRLLPHDLGGRAGTSAIQRRVREALERVSPEPHFAISASQRR